MIIPLGHDQLTLRRWPVVSFAIMVLCAAAFVASALGTRPDPKTVEERLSAALSYYVEHPQLDAAPQLRRALDVAIAVQEAAVQEEIRRRLSAPADAPSALDDVRQQRLDELTRAWLATSQTGPLWNFGLVPAHFSSERLLTHLFMHAGWLHLVFNLLFLYLSGPSLEDTWGRPMFALFYLAAGVASAGFFVAQYPDLAIPLVGASGAIAGLMGAFFVRFPRAEIRVLYFWMFRVGTTTIPAWLALLLWVSGELFSAYLMDHLAPGTGGAGVAHWGHVAGFAFGAAFAVAARSLGLEERVEAFAPGSDPLWRQADRALARGDEEEAWRALRERIFRSPSDDDAVLAYWDLARQLGRSREAAPVLLRLVRSEFAREDQDSALRHWNELREQVPDAAVPIGLAAELAGCIFTRGSTQEAIDLLRDALRRADAATAPQVLADLATTAATMNSALAAEAAARALMHPALPRGDRAALERLAAGAPVERTVAR